MTTQYFGGIEAGGTSSTVVILKLDGTLVSKHPGPGMNYYIEGHAKSIAILHNLVVDAKRRAGIESKTALLSLGMALCGVWNWQEDVKARIVKGLLELHPEDTSSAFVCTDTIGPIATAFPRGGVVLVAGTGSNCNIVNPDGTYATCGGLGHLLGDEGSAYWIVHEVVKAVANWEENFIPGTEEYETEKKQCDISAVRPLVRKHFCQNIDNDSVRMRNDVLMLDHCYPNFNKAYFASLCEACANLALNDDKLCQLVFKEAGRHLALHVLAVLPKVDKGLLSQNGGLHIVCVGSVWKSWQLLKDGFLEGIQSREDVKLPEFTLVKLNVSGAIGAAALGANKLNVTIPLNFADNTTEFFHFSKHELTAI
ncbi:unnamed protein product [Owenia fusiformis]|uniref:N-acetyl-D-glucosamine kinase n=1 Tax=Owenia fusiformis TaxID=6347 RepID=A0A8S4NPW5_OWEFU|nr:unnamed protein product [Owenia fusiformis]